MSDQQLLIALTLVNMACWRSQWSSSGAAAEPGVVPVLAAARWKS